MKRLLIAAAAALLAACGTTKIPVSYVGAFEPPANSGTIVFYRPWAFYSGGFRPDIFVDDKLVGHSAPGTVFKVMAAAGPHVVGVANQVAGHQALSIVVKPGQTAYVRTSIGLASVAGMVDLELMDAGIAAHETVTLESLN